MPRKALPEEEKRNIRVGVNFNKKEKEKLDEMFNDSNHQWLGDLIRERIFSNNTAVDKETLTQIDVLKKENARLEKLNTKIMKRLNGLFYLMDNKLPPLTALPKNMEEIAYNQEDFKFIDKVKKIIKPEEK